MRFLVLALLATAGCVSDPSVRSPRSSAGIQYVEATDDGGVVQAASEDAAEEQMRGRCPGGYSIVHVDPVPVGSVSQTTYAYGVATTRTDVVVAKRYTYACTRYRTAGQGGAST